jgi:hypothetical protein
MEKLKRQAKDLDIELSGVNLSKDEDALFKRFGITDDLEDFSKKTKLRKLIRMEQPQQQQQNGEFKFRCCSQCAPFCFRFHCHYVCDFPAAYSY